MLQSQRLVFMGTPSFAAPSLKMLAETGAWIGVVTQPDRPVGRGRARQESAVKQAAKNLGLPILQPHSLKDETVLQQLEGWRPSAIIVVAFGQILPQSLLDLPEHGCINVHASLLPKWRGAAPIPAAILAGDGGTGVSIMKMEQGLDTGPVYAQNPQPISPTATAGALHDRLSEKGARLLLDVLPGILSGSLQPRAQDHSLATYAAKIKKADGEIDWRQPARQIERQLRAYDPWPGSFTHWQGKRLIIHGGESAAGDWPVGAVGKHGERLAIGCGEGLLIPREMQIEGKRVLSSDEFIRGYQGVLGSQLAMREAKT